MQLDLVIATDTVDPKLRKAIQPRIERGLLRFSDRLLHVRAVLDDEHGRHGAPCYRCRLEVGLTDGGHVVFAGQHARPQGAVTDAIQTLRRHLAGKSEGLDSRARRRGRSDRLKAA